MSFKKRKTLFKLNETRFFPLKLFFYFFCVLFIFNEDFISKRKDLLEIKE